MPRGILLGRRQALFTGRRFFYNNPETAAYIAAMTVKPDDTRKAIIDAFIGSIKADGVLTKLDVLYLWAAHTQQAGNLNVKNPGVFTSAPSGSPVWTADRGYTGQGSSVLTTGYTPSTAGLNWAQNAAHIGGYVLTDVAEDAAIVGSASGAAPTGFLIPRSVGGNAVIRLNDNTNLVVANASSIGHFVGSRHGAASRNIYKNGVAIATDTTASTGVFAGELRFLRHPSLTTTRQIAVGHAGGDLTTANVLALYTALNTYLTAIGAL